MIIFAFFTKSGIPETGLSPVIDIWEDDGTQVVTSTLMAEVNGGFYQYDFTTYDGSKNYAIRADGGATLDNAERYVFSSNEVAGVWDEQLNDHTITGSTGATLSNIQFLADRVRNIEEGNWRIVGTQMIFYDINGVEIFRFNLFGESGQPVNDNVFERIRVP
jgi:hypothetical protein